MNLLQHKGIVLRTYVPRKQKLALFDYNLGRIECIVSLKNRGFIERLANGALLQYYAKPLHFLYELYEVELVDLPTTFARHDIYFLHHILELYYYFLPSELPSPELFELVLFLFNPPAQLYCAHGKKMFLLKFFGTLGLFPEETVSFNPDIYRLISLPIESMLKRNLDAPLQKEIENLIFACIGAHPYKKQFKTIYFISRMEYNDSNKP